MENQNTLWNTMTDNNNVTTTENGDKAYKSTLNPLMDFMFKACTMRKADEKEIENLFSRALAENEVYTVRLAFYARDIRGGQGERRVFRICMKYLANSRPETFKKIIGYIPEYGRWDDLVYLFGALNHQKIQDDIFNLIRDQYTEDLENCSNHKPFSLLAKWLPSENASSKNTIFLAKLIRNKLCITSKEYRKALSILRKELDIVERKLSAGKCGEINYNTVPSKAMLRYRKAFKRIDDERFSKYLSDLEHPEETGAKVNASTLYPFDIVNSLGVFSYGPAVATKDSISLAEAQWKALPDFFEGKFDNALVVADVSGSMTGDPINVCLGLAVYLAERNKGLFNNKFITFSNKPELQEIKGQNIYEKCVNLTKASWEMNTDIDAVFNLIYTSATENKLKAEELPTAIYIISDMQFDCCSNGEDVTVFEKWTKKFEEAGYKLPLICFWNVSNYGNENVPITVKDTGAIVCSGYSPAIIKYIMESDITNTMTLVENIVLSKRYNAILSENN